jgi:transcriptional regulator with XRE-family HTH domain
MEDKLVTWLIENCESRNLSWGEASTRAGLNRGAISAIINGQVPGLKVCLALADFFGVTPEFILRLAGHLPNYLSDDDGESQILA